MIVTGAELLIQAKKGGYAVPAFNVDNLESVLGVLNAVEKTCKPTIIQTIPKTLKYGGIPAYSSLVRALYKDGVDIAIHLDHGGDIKICEDCINAGYSSVMIDGSMSRGISVEAELGTIGGKEETEGQIKYTEVEEAKEFVERTRVDSLAIGVGTAHGVYKGEPHIAIDRIKEIADVVDVPLVLHGASGLSDEVIRACIDAGISKINFATHLRQAFTDGLKKGLASKEATYDPKTYLPYAIKAVEDVATKIIRLCQPI